MRTIFLFGLITLFSGFLFPEMAWSQSYNKWIRDLEFTTDTNKLREIAIYWGNKYQESHLETDLINKRFAEGFISYHKGNQIQWIEQLAWIIHAHPHLHNDQTAWANYHMASSLAYYNVRKLAVEYSDKNIQDATLTKNREMLHQAHRVKAGLLFHEKEFVAALKHFKLAIQYSNPNDPGAFASDLNNIGLTYYRMKQYQLALNYYQRGVLLLDGNSSHLAQDVQHLMIGNIGTVYVDMGKLEAGRTYLEKEADYYRRFSPRNTTFPSTLNELIRLYQLTGEQDKVQIAARELLGVIRKMDNETEQLEVMKNLMIYSTKRSVGIDQLELTTVYNDILKKHIEQLSATQDAINRTIYTEKITDLQNAAIEERREFQEEQANQRFRTISYVTFFILALLALGTMVVILRQRAVQAKQKLVIQQQNEYLARKQQIILEHENIRHKEHLNLLLTNIKIKQKTETGFLNKIKELKRKKNTNIDQLINELQLSVNNLVDIDRKMVNDDLPNLELNKAFADKLLERHPELNETELNYCNYFVSGLSAKEIGLLHNQSDVSVRVFKNKIKKKMGLNRDILLDDYIREVYNEANGF